MALYRRLVFGLCVCVAVLPPALLGGDEAQDPSSLCDDGKYKIGEDLGGPENWECQRDVFQITKFPQPSYHEECAITVEESSVQCMDTPLHYDDHPPSVGKYRPLRPKYGDYQYLPPQRWLGTLKYGAVVFLYHPCAPQDQVAQLRGLALSCLWRHFISPYPHLNSEWPMALVSWGCVLRVSWVEVEALRNWIASHALHTPLAADVTTNGVYDAGLLHEATKIEVDGKEVTCPQSHLPTLPNSPSAQHTITNLPIPTTDKEDNSEADNEEIRSATCSTPPVPTVTTQSEKDQQVPPQTNHSSLSPCRLPAPTCCPNHNTNSFPYHLLVQHHTGYAILIMAACIVLFGAVAVFTWKLCTRNGHNRRRAKYKSVSKFFPFSYGQQLDCSSDGVAIPEYGLPKTGQAEREMLLNESDEDEI